MILKGYERLILFDCGVDVGIIGKREVPRDEAQTCTRESEGNGKVV